LTIVEEREYLSHVSYSSTISSLIYVMECTRFYLSQVVSMVSRCMHDPRRGSLGGYEVDCTVHLRYNRCWFGVQEGYSRKVIVYRICWFRLCERP